MGIKKLRFKIDSIDNKIIKLLAERADVVKEIYSYKRKNKIPLFDGKREKQILDNTQKKAGQLKVSRLLAEDIFKRILKESHKIKK